MRLSSKIILFRPANSINNAAQTMHHSVAGWYLVYATDYTIDYTASVTIQLNDLIIMITCDESSRRASVVGQLKVGFLRCLLCESLLLVVLGLGSSAKVSKLRRMHKKQTFILFGPKILLVITENPFLRDLIRPFGLTHDHLCPG